MCYAYDFTNEMNLLRTDLVFQVAQDNNDSHDYCVIDFLVDLFDSMEDEFINTLMEGYK